MAFEATKTTIMQKADTKQMESELAHVGMKLELAKQQLAIYRNLTDEIEKLKAERDLIKVSKEAAEYELADYRWKFKDTQEKTTKLETEKADNQALISQQERTIEDNKRIIGETEREKNSVGKKMALLQDAISIAENNLANLKAEGEKENERLKKEREILQVDILKLTDKQAESANKLTIINKDIENKKETLFSINDDIKTGNNAKDILEDEIAETKADMEKYKLEYDKKIASDNADLKIRQGEVSLRESWLAEKTEQIKKAKQEIEKYYNKKIDINL